MVCALEMFNEDYVTFPRDDIAKLSGLTMPVNKRNWRKQPVHLQGARAIQEINDKANGTNWREGNGRPKGSGTAQARVYEWRQQHPEGRKADCHRETGLDPKTVRKWWDCPLPAVRFENGHITVRVSPSQELSDWLLDALHDGGQNKAQKGPCYALEAVFSPPRVKYIGPPSLPRPESRINQGFFCPPKCVHTRVEL